MATGASSRLRAGAGAVAVVLGLAASGAGVALAETDQAIAARGKALLEEKCASCHATGTSGESPREGAPPFRTLSQKYPVSQLAEALAEGIVTGHNDMPQFVFTPAEIEAIIAYLEAINPPRGK